MSVKLMAEVMENSPYEGTQLLVHLILADHANEDGICWPSIARIAKRARVQERWVQRLMAQMETDGCITRSERPGRSNLIQVHGYAGGVACTPPPTYAKGVASTPGGGGLEARGGVACEPPRTIIESSKNLGAASRRESDPIFEALCEVCGIDWEAKITKDERGRVNKATQQLREVDATPDEIRRRAREYHRRFPQVAITPQALVGQWGQLEGPQEKANHPPLWQPDRGDEAAADPETARKNLEAIITSLGGSKVADAESI